MKIAKKLCKDQVNGSRILVDRFWLENVYNVLNDKGNKEVLMSQVEAMIIMIKDSVKMKETNGSVVKISNSIL